jgi:TonB-linked SusC/RagA family outer membrane protein
MRKLSALFAGVLLFIGGPLLAQRTVTGTVSDETGAPLANATVLVKNTRVGTVTSVNGTYSINVPANGRILVFTGVDRQDQEVPIGERTVINVTLQATDKTLNEVVLTGYTARKRTEATGASTKVTNKTIAQIPIASFEQILQGQAPGLYVASGSGQPGAAARVLIRGVGSISGGNTPLYILDGVPIEDAVFRTLNPNDFETVDVLKDAASAGIYGSRGANGVIVITSKKGKPGRTLLQYRGQVGYSAPPTLYNLKMMNTAERLQYEEKVLGGPAGILSTSALTGYPGWDYSPNNPRYQTLTTAQRAAEALLLDSIRKIDTDWADVFFRNGAFSQHEVSASGGNQGFNFFTSLSYYKQEGVIIRSNLERYTFRANLGFKTNRLTVDLRSAAGFSQLDNIESEAGVALANPIAAAYLELPYRSLTKGINGPVDTGSGKTGANAYDRLFTTTQLTNQFKGTLGLTAQFDIWGGIALRSINGVDWRNNNTSRFIDPNSFAGRAVASGAQGSYNEGNSENLQLITTTGLVFNRTFSMRHVVNASAMVEAIRNRGRNFNATGFGINPRLPNTPAGITAGSSTNNLIPTIGGTRDWNGLFSAFVLGDYTFDRKYSVSASVRYDAPSQVPQKNRSNDYYTIGASWNFIRERFMEGIRFINEGRLRGSYGESANINGFTSNFGYISTYGNGSYAGTPAIVPTSPGNEDYKIESQVQKDLGLELSMWNRRLRTVFDFYIKDSRNLFLAQQVTRISGFRTLSTNIGEVRNKGFEFDVDIDPIATTNLLVTIGVNGAFNKNEVTKMGLITELAGGTGITRVGLPLGTHYIVQYLGVDPQSGLPIYADLNGNPTNIYSATNSRTVFGSFNPKFTGGASLDITWKGFFLGAFFTTAQGLDRFNNESFFYETTNSNLAFNKRVELLQTWQKPGDITNWQRISSTREFSSKDIRDASFIRFRNLQAGYTFTPKNQNYVRSVRLWGQGQNLYTWTEWTGFDPEESNNIATYEFPNPKTFSIGLDINF